MLIMIIINTLAWSKQPNNMTWKTRFDRTRQVGLTLANRIVMAPPDRTGLVPAELVAPRPHRPAG